MDELRNDDIWAMHRKGATLKEIAATLGIKVEEARAVIIRKWRALADKLRYTGRDCLDSGGLLPTLKRILGTEGSWRDVLLSLADLIAPEGVD